MTKKKEQNSEIAYQNKDIVSKLMAEEFKGKTFAVYGIDVPEIVEAKPTNLPAIEADELRLDNLFLLADGSYAIVDYESKYCEKNCVDYLKYLARVVERLYNEIGHFVPVKLIIIYTADVKAGTTKPILDLGGVELRIIEAFLSDFNSEETWDSISGIIQQQKPLSDEDMMRLIIYPLTFMGKKEKQTAVGRAIELAKKIGDDRQKVFLLKLIWTFSDKFITDEDAERVKEELNMTKVDRLYAEEKRKAVEETTRTVTEKVTNNVSTHIAENMLIDGDPIEKVSKNTGLSLATVKNLLKSIEQRGVRIATL